MMNMLHINNKKLSYIMYGTSDVSFKVFFDDELQLQQVRSSRGSDVTYKLTNREKEDLMEFIKDDIMMTATEFAILEKAHKVERC